MDPHYAIAKFGLESKDILRSQQKGCWHYTKYFFIFLSIIQFLIILGLVLFMLYGNAHVGTEHRLKSVENRYANLTMDYLWLQGNFSMLKAKLANAEKQFLNCSEFVRVQSRQIEAMNRTNIYLRTTLSPDCRRLQAELDHLKMNCSNERLQLQNYMLRCDADARKYKENCTKLINDLTIKEKVSAYEASRLQKESTDQRTQFKICQDTCTNIFDRFWNEIEKMKKHFEVATRAYDSYGTNCNCKVLSNTISNSIDQTIISMRQETEKIVIENSRIKAAQERFNQDLKKCTEEKEGLTKEKITLLAEKTEIQKQLNEKTSEQNKVYSQYIKKSDELENCQKMQFPRYIPSRP